MHLFCYLVHVTNVRSLIRIGVYAHADQLPQLKHRKQADVNDLRISDRERHRVRLTTSPGQELQPRPQSLPGGCSVSCVPSLQKDQEEPFPSNLQH